MSRPARAGERGMSLVEVLVALTILAFALLGLMPLFVGAVKTAASANQLTNANTLVREKLEELDGYPRGDPRVSVPSGANAAVPTGVTTTGSGSVVAVNTYCNNDLPSWYQPSTGAVSFASTSPGAGWYVYPYFRTYTVELFGPLPATGAEPDLTTRVTSTVTTLSAAITTTTATTLSATSNTGFPAPPYQIQIDSEEMQVTSVSGTTWTVTRGYNGTTAATHASGATISAPASYAVKLLTVTVSPTRGPFPGLRKTTQSLYLRLPNG